MSSSGNRNYEDPNFEGPVYSLPGMAKHNAAEAEFNKTMKKSEGSACAIDNKGDMKSQTSTSSGGTDSTKGGNSKKSNHPLVANPGERVKEPGR